MLDKKTINVIIVEDSRQEALLLESLLSKYSEIKIIGIIGHVADGAEIIHKKQPDIVFLDIELIDGNGFDLLDRIKNIRHRPAVIFTTGFDNYAIQAIRHAALDYLLKPIDPNELDAALNRYFNSLGESPNPQQWQMLLEQIGPGHSVKINTNNGFTIIHTNDIIYCEADGNYTDLYLLNDKMLTTSMHLGKIEELLPDGQFFRVHRSVTINLKFLSSVNRQKKRCYLNVNGKQFEFCMPTIKMRELEREL